MASTQTMTRRRFIEVLGVGASASLLAACQATPPATSPTAAPPPAVASKPTAAAQPETAVQAPSKPAAAGASPVGAAAGKPLGIGVSSGDVPKRGGTFRVGIGGQVGIQLDPHVSLSDAEWHVFRNIYDTLLEVDDKLAILPGLAESYEWQGSTLTLHLRQGVKFHDGTPFNAEAVKFNLERQLDAALKPSTQREVADLDHVEVVDDTTARLVLKTSSGPFMFYLTDRVGMMISPTAFKQLGQDFGRKPVGTGPFKFVDWVTNSHLTLGKNTDYWQVGADGQSLPYLDQVVMREYPDSSSRTAAFKAGDIELIDQVKGADAIALEKDPNTVLLQSKGFGVAMIMLNQTRPPFNNPNLRKALYHAIDREAALKALAFGRGTLARSSPIYPAIAWAYDPAAPSYQTDATKVKEFLTAGGAPQGFSFTLLSRPQDPLPAMAELFQSQWKQLGIDAKVETIEASVQVQRRNQQDFDAAILISFPGMEPDQIMTALVICEGWVNNGKFCDPRIDTLLQQAKRSTDQAERKQLYRQVSDLEYEDADQLWLHYEWREVGLQKKVKGFYLVPDLRYRAKTVWLEG